MPIAMMLLSCGWNARKVAAGGGGMKVVIVCIVKTKNNLVQREKDQDYTTLENKIISELSP